MGNAKLNGSSAKSMGIPLTPSPTGVYIGYGIGEEETPMPWRETCAMDQRVQFIGYWLSGHYAKIDLCEFYGISRPTGEKWIRRLGLEGLNELSRAAKHHPNAIDSSLCERIVQYKLRHQCFGPKKVMDGLRREDPGVNWPADSMAGENLKRAGLPTRRPVRSRHSAIRRPPTRCPARLRATVLPWTPARAVSALLTMHTGTLGRSRF